MDRTACAEPQCLYSTAIPLLPLWAVRPVQSLSACTRLHFTFVTYRKASMRRSTTGNSILYVRSTIIELCSISCCSIFSVCHHRKPQSFAWIMSMTYVSAIRSDSRHKIIFRSWKSLASLSQHVNLSPEQPWTDCHTTCRLSPVLHSLLHTTKLKSLHSPTLGRYFL